MRENVHPSYSNLNRDEPFLSSSHHLSVPLPLASWQEIYCKNDYVLFLNPNSHYPIRLRSIEDLIERDKLRERDGFPRKIKISKLIRPGKDKNQKVVIVPSAEEEKFYHDYRLPSEKDSEEANKGQTGQTGGSGTGEEGEVIGEEPIHTPGGQGAGSAGSGEGAEHDINSDVYELGKILTEKFQLPNLQNKGKKRSLTRYNYDLTSRNRGEGQVLDKKATLKQIIKTNIGLERIHGPEDLDSTQFIVSRKDLVYHVLSKEQDYEAQAIVFFIRDYSGSMYGAPTEVIVAQHILIYTWLMYQYQKQVETRFIVHDTEAKEVDDFYSYAHSSVAGGTQIASAFGLVYQIITQNNLAQDYNIYLFYGGDGDDWDSEGKKCLEYIENLLPFINRIGFVITKTTSSASNLERYLRHSSLLTKYPHLLRLDVIEAPAEEDQIIESLKRIIS